MKVGSSDRDQDGRVPAWAITPAGVREMVEHGHEVVIQADAGDGSVIPDQEFVDQGARIVPTRRPCSTRPN